MLFRTWLKILTGSFPSASAKPVISGDEADMSDKGAKFCGGDGEYAGGWVSEDAVVAESGTMPSVFAFSHKGAT